MIRSLAALAFALTAFGSSVALADDNALKAQLQARYDELSRQLMAMNWDAVRAMELPGYRSVDVDGSSMTSEEELAAIGHMPPQEDEDGSTTVLSVRVTGSLAYVEQRVESTASVKDVAGKVHAIETRALSSDIWKLVDGQWLILQTVTNQVDTEIDGKPVLHKAQPLV